MQTVKPKLLILFKILMIGNFVNYGCDRKVKSVNIMNHKYFKPGFSGFLCENNKIRVRYYNASNQKIVINTAPSRYHIKNNSFEINNNKDKKDSGDYFVLLMPYGAYDFEINHFDGDEINFLGNNKYQIEYYYSEKDKVNLKKFKNIPFRVPDKGIVIE